MRHMTDDEIRSYREDCEKLFKSGEILEIELSTFDEVELI